MSEVIKIVEGKTKIIYSAADNEEHVLIESKDTITAGDGARSDIMPGKAELATETTSNIFRSLGEQGIKNHFIEQTTPRQFRALRMDMIPLEIAARRHAYGSYSQRNPGMVAGRSIGFFVVEFFAKDDVRNDPLIMHNYKENTVEMYDAHKPLSANSLIKSEANESSRFGVPQKTRREMVTLAMKSFRLLESKWEEAGYMLVDMKIECGTDPSGEIIIGDVIDNDSWRLWRNGDPNQMVDKQLYRDGRPLEEVAQAYAEVAQATKSF